MMWVTLLIMHGLLAVALVLGLMGWLGIRLSSVTLPTEMRSTTPVVVIEFFSSRSPPKEPTSTSPEPPLIAPVTVNVGATLTTVR